MISALLLLVGLGSALGGIGWGFQRGERQGVDVERARLRSLREPYRKDSAELMQIFSIPDARGRAEALFAFLDRYSPEDASTLDGAFRNLLLFPDPVSVAMLVEWWARFAPRSALAALSTPVYARERPLAGGGHTTWILATLFRQWARAEPREAAEALDNLVTRQFGSDQPGKESLLTSLALGWAESGREGVWEYVEALPSGSSRQHALDALTVWLVANEGLEAAIAFVEALPPGGRHSFKLQSHRRLAGVAARRDPRRAAEWARDRESSPFGEGMLYHVAVEWGRRDGRAAMEWFAEQPDSVQVQEAARETYLQWLRAERSEAMTWMRENGPGPAVWGPALALFVFTEARNQPEKAAEWLRFVQGSEKQMNSITLSVLRSWLAKDRSRALDWMESANLSAEVRQTLLESAGPGDGATEE